MKVVSVVGLALILSACGDVGGVGGDPIMSDSGFDPSSDIDFDPSSDEALYRVTFTANWTSEAGAVPGSAHFTTLAGAVVTDLSELWESGELASSGLEELAEIGQVQDFILELNDEVTASRALETFTASGTGATGDREFELTFSRTYPNLTFATMVAPSPDWFVGLDRHPLLNNLGEWKTDETVELRVYDAGTEEGSGYSLANSETDPREPIARLNVTVDPETVFSDGLANGESLARIRFERISPE